MGDWRTWVSTEDMQRRASGRRAYNKRRQLAAQARRQEVQRLTVRWGTTPAARVRMAQALHVSLTTIDRDLKALQEAPPLPLICPLCHLPSRLDLDPATLTDDPAELAALEQALARLIGAEPDPTATPRPRPRATHPERRQMHDRLAPRG